MIREIIFLRGMLPRGKYRYVCDSISDLFRNTAHVSCSHVNGINWNKFPIVGAVDEGGGLPAHLVLLSSWKESASIGWIEKGRRIGACRDLSIDHDDLCQEILQRLCVCCFEANVP